MFKIDPLTSRRKSGFRNLMMSAATAIGAAVASSQSFAQSPPQPYSDQDLTELVDRFLVAERWQQEPNLPLNGPKYGFLSDRTPSRPLRPIASMREQRERLSQMLSQSFEGRAALEAVARNSAAVRIAPVAREQLTALFCEPVQIYGVSSGLPRKEFATTSRIRHAACDSNRGFAGIDPSSIVGLSDRISYVDRASITTLATLRELFSSEDLPLRLKEWVQLISIEAAMNTGEPAEQFTESGRLKPEVLRAYLQKRVTDFGFRATVKTESYSSTVPEALPGTGLFGFSDDRGLIGRLERLTPDSVKLGTSSSPNVVRTIFYDANSRLLQSEFAPKALFDQFDFFINGYQLGRIPFDQSPFGSTIGEFSFPLQILFILDSLDTNNSTKDNLSVQLFRAFYGLLTRRVLTCDGIGGECAAVAQDVEATRNIIAISKTSWVGADFNSRWLLWSDLFAFKGDEEIRSLAAWKAIADGI